MQAMPHSLYVLVFAITLHLTTAQSQEVYTQNAICRTNYCTNPLFPGLNDLSRLETIAWQASTHGNATAHMDFCRHAVYYDPAVPTPITSAQPLNLLIKSQDDAASTMFFYHLGGMGYDAWDHRDPSQGTDGCVKAVWRMVCYTYFPKAGPASLEGQSVSYQRPCQDVCSSYLQSCSVECCDESPQCVFTHTVPGTVTANGTALVQTGYHNQVGPSAMCTGQAQSSGRRSGASVLLLLGVLGFHLFGAGTASGSSSGSGSRAGANVKRESSKIKRFSPWLAGAVLVVIGLSLQGCAMDVPRHHVGNWRRQPDYLVGSQFVMPGAPASSAQLNSCQRRGIPATLQCSGRGYCRAWTQNNAALAVAGTTPVQFCECERDWAGPECQTRRKSQLTAFLLSLFLGFFGADYFYLGFPLWGIVKLFTLGGCGFWWLLDIIRTGSGNIYAHDFRVAADLPHWVYVLVVLTVFMMIGFFVAIESYLGYRNKKRGEQLKLQSAEEAHHAGMGSNSNFGEYGGARQRSAFGRGIGPTQAEMAPTQFGGYGSTMGQPQGPGGSYPWAA